MRRAILVAAAAAAVLTLSACTPAVPSLGPAPSPSEEAAVVDAQVQRILPETFAELAAGDEAKSTKGFVDRIGGNAKAVRSAEYKQEKADKKAVPDVLPEESQAVYVSAEDTWPRVLINVTEQASDDVTPVVMMWIQDSVDDDYQLRAWAHMIPGATLPAMPGFSTGATQLALDDTSLSPSPGKVLEDYITLLNEGPKSDLNDSFADDSYKDQLFTNRTALTKAAKKAKGSYKDVVTTDEDGAYVLETADGGALIFAPVTVKSTMKVKGAKLTIPKAHKALIVGKKPTTTLVYTFNDFVVLYEPPAGVTEKSANVAAEHKLVKVSAK